MAFGASPASMADMGLAPGGRMKQSIHADKHDFADWDRNHSARCIVHLANSLVWRSITGAEPPTVPLTAKEYDRAGLPWFEYYAADREALSASPVLQGVKSVAQMAAGTGALPENENVGARKVAELREGLRKGQVRERAF